LTYLRAFAREHIDPSHFRFGAEVRDYRLRDSTHWSVTLASGEMLSTKAVIVCTGLYWEPQVPPSAFQAAPQSWIHSRDFTPRSIRSGDRVCVVGAGNSSADVAVSAYRAGAEVWLRWRGVPWLVPSFLDGCPTDTLPLELEGIPTCMWGAATQHQLASKAMPTTQRVAGIVGDTMPAGLPYESPTITSDRLLTLLLDHDRVHVTPLRASPPPVDLTVYCTGYAKPRGTTGLARPGIGLDPTRVVSTSLPGLFVVGNVMTEGGGFGIFSRMAQVVSGLIVTQLRDRREYHRTLARLAVWKPDLLWGLRRPSPASGLVYSEALLYALNHVGELGVSA
jgi:Flavin-binding monooxygenase-like